MRALRRSRTRGWPALLSLAGALLAACDQVDVSSSAEPPSARCASCHLPEYLATDHPPHRGVKPTTCGTCHTQTGFHPSRIEHSFPLDGAHAKADCFACHTGAAPAFEGTPKSCATCHATEHARANQSIPKHQSFGDDCAHCHGTSAWKPAVESRGGGEALLRTPEAPTLVPSAASTTDVSAPSSPRRSPAVPKPTSTPAPAPDSRPSPSKRRSPDSVSGASPAWKR